MPPCEQCRSREPVLAPAARLRRIGRRLGQWSLPGLTILLLPKCPLCLAGSITLMTGFGLSVGLARWLHHGLWGLSLGLLGLLCLQTLIRLVRRAPRKAVLPSSSLFWKNQGIPHD